MICYVYRPKKSRIWRYRLRLQFDISVTDGSLRTADKQVAKQRLVEITQEREREAAGIIAPKIQREAASRKLSEHLEKFIEDLQSTGHADTYSSLIEFRVGRLISECGWNFVRDVTPSSFQQWRSHQNAAAKTLNDYLDAISCLLNWMVDTELILVNHLKSVARTDDEGRKTRVRRSFTGEEMKRLISVAGPRRAVYLTAVHTGLRRGELGALKKWDVTLDVPVPFLKIAGEFG